MKVSTLGSELTYPQVDYMARLGPALTGFGLYRAG